MKAFAAEQLAAMAAQCNIVMASCDVATHMLHRGNMHADPDNIQRAAQLFANLRILLTNVGLHESLQQLDLVEFTLGQPRNSTNVALSMQLSRILDTLTVELRKRKFLFIEADRTGFLDNDCLFGDSVKDKFKLACPDIQEAGNCLATECNTAAVFHLMLAFEWCLRTFASDLGLNRFKDWSPKRGQFQYTPVGYGVWEKLLTQLPKKAEKRINALRPGARKQRLQEYYSSCFEDIKWVKDAWRNHIMHSRQQYDRDQALSVFTHVRDIMQRMAHGV